MGKDTKKTVRFVDHKPRIRPPALSSSTSYGSSSGGPVTPPDLYPQYLPPVVIQQGTPVSQHTPPYVRIPPSVVPIFPDLLRVPDSRVTIDPLLAAPLHASHPPSLVWDVREDPNTIRVRDPAAPHARPRAVAHSDAARPAVRRGPHGSPHLLKRAYLVFPGLPFLIRVTPAKSPWWTQEALPYLTTGDVLLALHRALGKPLEQREWEGLDRGLKERAWKTFERRVDKEGPGELERNRAKGVTKVDLLERRMLVGLELAVGREIPPGLESGEVFVVLLDFVR